VFKPYVMNRYRNQEVFRSHQFRSYNFNYDQEKDQCIYPGQKRLSYFYTAKTKPENGYESPRRFYESEGYQDCPLKEQCSTAKGTRKIQLSFKLMEYRR
jgi:hypothetical protein